MKLERLLAYYPDITDRLKRLVQTKVSVKYAAARVGYIQTEHGMRIGVYYVRNNRTFESFQEINVEPTTELIGLADSIANTMTRELNLMSHSALQGN